MAIITKNIKALLPISTSLIKPLQRTAAIAPPVPIWRHDSDSPLKV
jgi:hypothetical protein